MPGIVELGHTGLWVTDLDRMRAFYTQLMGLTVTDEDPEIGIVFLSSRPDVEHHEFVLQRGRTAAPGAKLTHQISWRLDSIEALVDCHRRFREAGVSVQQEVTHGNALGIYFFDPEGNRNEVYWLTGAEVPQPFRKSIDLDLPLEQILDESTRLVTDGAPAYQPVQ